MGYFLLWIEDLAVSLLFVATVVACLVQLEPRQSRWLARGLALLVLCTGELATIVNLVTSIGIRPQTRDLLLWITVIAVFSLLFLATLVACLTPSGPGQSRWSIRRFALLVLCAGNLAVVGVMAGFGVAMDAPFSLPLIAVTVVCTISGVWVLLWGPWLATMAVLTVLVLVPLAIDALCVLWTAPLYFHDMISGLLAPALMVLTGAYGLGAVAMLVYGLRRARESALVRAGTWPRGRLTVALLVAVALHATTFWNMDLVARQQMAALRTEAGALALSVAPPRLADRNNAAIVYQRAFEAFGGCNAAAPDAWKWEKQWQDAWIEKWIAWHEEWQESEKIGFDLHDPELRRFLKRQSSTLTLLRQAGAMPGCNFGRDYGHLGFHMNLPPPVVEASRDAAWLLALDAIFRADGKDYREAVEDVNAMFRLAEHVRADPILISQIHSIVVDSYAIDTLRRVLASGRMPPEDIASICLPEGTSYRTCMQLAVRMDQAFLLAVFDQLASGRYGPVDVGGSGSGRFVPVIPAWFYRMFLLADDMAAEEQIAALLDSAIGQSYDRAIAIVRQSDQNSLSQPKGVMAALWFDLNSRFFESLARAEARCGTARVGVALCAYRARNGHFPEKLDDLVPEFISAIPRDPFGSQPMKLKRTEHELIVYSIGPDMTDNGGAPIDELTKTGDITFTVK